MKKVAFVSESLQKEGVFRGISVHNLELLRAIEGIRPKRIRLYNVGWNEKNLNRFDLVHFSLFRPYTISFPFLKRIKKTLITIHDLIPLLYPKNYPPGIKGNIIFFLQKFIIKRNIDAIITISETSKKDICRFIGVKPEKVYVVHLAPRPYFGRVLDKQLLYKIKKKYCLPDRFVLYVGDINYNKNLAFLIKAIIKLRIPLVICGKQAKEIENIIFPKKEKNIFHIRDFFRSFLKRTHPELSHLEEILKFLRKDKKGMIRRLGFVPDADLKGIYSLATVYCQPSLYEGFGLPILEAMKCGCPVLASKIQAHVEIAADGCLFFDPKDFADLSKKLKEIINDEKLRKILVKKGYEVVKNYSWEKTARETIKVYEKVLSEK